MQAARLPGHIMEVGEACSHPGAMTGAGYGAAGLMTWLADKGVASQILAAKKHRRYPRSRRPSSRDRRMICLAVAVAAGVWKIEYGTALRKLAKAGLGISKLAAEVHRSEHFQETLRRNSHVWAEPVANFFVLVGRRWEQLRDLPCSVPANWQGGYILYGFGPDGPQATFSRTLPVELLEVSGESEEEC